MSEPLFKCDRCGKALTDTFVMLSGTWCLECAPSTEEQLLTRKQLVMIKALRMLLMKELGFKLTKAEVEKLVIEMGEFII